MEKADIDLKFRLSKNYINCFCKLCLHSALGIKWGYFCNSTDESRIRREGVFCVTAISLFRL